MRQEIQFQNGGNRKDVGVTVGFSTKNKLPSKIIRWITRGRASHVWIAFYDKTLGRRIVLQAEIWGYEVRPWKRWLRENIWVQEFELPASSHTVDAVQAIANYLGTEYDFESAVLSAIWKWIKKWWEKPTNNPSKLMCAEAVLVFLTLLQINEYDDLNPQTTTPEELLKRMEKDSQLKALSAPL